MCTWSGFIISSPLSAKLCNTLGHLINITYICISHWGFPGGSDGKESACNAGDLGSIPRLGRSLEKEMATHSSLLPGKSHGRMEEPGSLQSMGSRRVGHNLATTTTMGGGQARPPRPPLILPVPLKFQTQTPWTPWCPEVEDTMTALKEHTTLPRNQA